MCEDLFLFILCQNVLYYCTGLSAVFDWICSLQVFIIIIIIRTNLPFSLIMSEFVQSLRVLECP